MNIFGALTSSLSSFEGYPPPRAESVRLSLDSIVPLWSELDETRRSVKNLRAGADKLYPNRLGSRAVASMREGSNVVGSEVPGEPSSPHTAKVDSTYRMMGLAPELHDVSTRTPEVVNGATGSGPYNAQTVDAARARLDEVYSGSSAKPEDMANLTVPDSLAGLVTDAEIYASQLRIHENLAAVYGPNPRNNSGV
jgi:hypothetical protein